MGIKRVFLWELGDVLRFVIFLLLLFSLTYLLGTSYLRFQWGVGSFSGAHPPVYGSENALGSMTAEHLFNYPTSSIGFWILLALGISVFSMMGIRYDRERGYAFSIYSLPYSKRDIFLGKLFSILLMSLLALYLPILIVDVFPNVDILRIVLGIVFTRLYLNALVFAFYFLIFSMAVSLFFSVLLRDMLLAFIASFFLLVLPFFAGLNWPPFSFVPMIHRALAGASPFELSYLASGLVFPASLIVLSAIIFTRRDVL
ncbi:hypothetical protein [Thermococcus sp.]